MASDMVHEVIQPPADRRIILAFDTANEIIAIGVGLLIEQSKSIECIASRQVRAHRASNTQLLPQIDALLRERGIARDQLACVACGRGPGSFTGVRICIATAKGIASALEAPLVGVSTLDAIAWRLQDAGYRGSAMVLADAMRKEVYPVPFELTDDGAERRNVDTVVKAQEEAERLAGRGVLLAGDALEKYADLFTAAGAFAPRELWTTQGRGLLLAAQAAWRAGSIDPFDAVRHDPAVLLPVYTRLSDAEENERKRLAQIVPRDLQTGVQHPGNDTRDSAIANAKANERGIAFRPLDASCTDDVARMESALMGSDAWNRAQVLDDLPRPDRTWWAAFDDATDRLVAYAGGWVVDGQLQVLKVACDPDFRRRGIARELVARLASDARDLGATEATLEVRASNHGAQTFYTTLALRNVGMRPHYYSDREDAVIMAGPLPLSTHDVAGMELLIDQAGEVSADTEGMCCAGTGFSDDPHSAAHEGETQATGRVLPKASTDASSAACAVPLILAIETSCDETAAATIGGSVMLSDVVASQIDFHARFGGVVPEIASRKHIEAICGVAQVCLEQAAANLGVPRLRWRDLDAVAVTYAPGLVGALVVGVAFAKGAAWGADIPFIGVNHLEGHLYANKLAQPDMQPPMVVSLVSGGHTMLVHVRDWGDYEILGSTVDDAVGEAFDKVAKALGLGYPGGPVISRLAAQGNPKAIRFPRAMMHSGDLRFSLSGLKTAVITYIDGERKAHRELNLPDIAASFEAAVVDVQVSKATRALKQTGAKEFCLGGGVAANPMLRATYATACAKLGVRLTMPPLSACTDNAAMIALVAVDRWRQGRFFGLDADAYAHTDLQKPY